MVDTPANELEFIVLKRQEMEDMSIEQEATAQPVAKDKQAAGAPPEVLHIETSKGADADVLKQVTALVETIAKAAGAQLPVAKSEGAEDDTEDQDAEKAGAGPRGLFRKQLVAAGMKGDALTKAMADFDKAFPPADAKTAKKVLDEDDTAEDDITKQLDGVVSAIIKGKAFTPKRQKALEGAVKSLQDLLKDLTPTAVPQGGSPSTSTPTSPSFGASGVDDLMAKVAKQLEGITALLTTTSETTKSLAERVETIEKARTPATALPTEITDTKVTKNKGFWSGAL